MEHAETNQIANADEVGSVKDTTGMLIRCMSYAVRRCQASC